MVLTDYLSIFLKHHTYTHAHTHRDTHSRRRLCVWGGVRGCTMFSFPAGKSSMFSMTVANPPNFLCVPLLSSNVQRDSLLLRTITFWNRLPRSCFTEHYNIDIFQCRVNISILHSFIRTPPTFRESYVT